MEALKTTVPADKRHQSTAAAAITPSVKSLHDLNNLPLHNLVPKGETRVQSASPAAGANPYNHLSDKEVLEMYRNGKLRFFSLEKELGDMQRAVKIRRDIVEEKIARPGALNTLQYENYNYNEVYGQCCENVVGVVQIPVGVAGPILVDGKEHFLPMATTEGALVASTSRGCRAILESGGCNTEVVREGMTRAPVIGSPSAKEAYEIQKFCENQFADIAATFNSTSNFARLKEIKCTIAGRKIFLRFRCTTGDGMGMNMAGKGTDKALKYILDRFPSSRLIALSGNVCTDKKPSAINWIEGRGKSVVCEAVIKKEVVEKILKTTVEAMVETNYTKNFMGSAIAGSIGGNNAHASNVVTSMFIACGQDPAQNVESSNCMTIMEKADNGRDLYVAVTMPSIEVGTIGGGTILSPQSASLELLGVKGSDASEPGKNARQLARLISSGVLAGELSLMAALTSGHLISAHMQLNRKPAGTK